MRDLRTIVTGNVAKDVTEHRYEDGTVTAIIRLASTSRYFDQDKGEFSDRKTEFFTVYARRALARHVIESVSKGDPLIVSGRLGSAEWVKDGRTGYSMTIQAEAIGHDLTFGSARFERDSRRGETPMLDERTGEIVGIHDDASDSAEPVQDAREDDTEGIERELERAQGREPAMSGDAPF